MPRRSNVSWSAKCIREQVCVICSRVTQSLTNHLCEWFTLKLSDPFLLVGMYFTTPQHKNIYMIHGMRGYQKVAKSCNKIYKIEYTGSIAKPRLGKGALLKWRRNTLTPDRPSCTKPGTAFNNESMKDLGSCTKQLPLIAQMCHGLVVLRLSFCSCRFAPTVRWSSVTNLNLILEP